MLQSATAAVSAIQLSIVDVRERVSQTRTLDSSRSCYLYKRQQAESFYVTMITTTRWKRDPNRLRTQESGLESETLGLEVERWFVFVMNATECNKDRIILHDRKSDYNCQQQNWHQLPRSGKEYWRRLGWMAGRQGHAAGSYGSKAAGGH